MSDQAENTSAPARDDDQFLAQQRRATALGYATSLPSLSTFGDVLFAARAYDQFLRGEG